MWQWIREFLIKQNNMDQYSIMILIFTIGMLIGGYLHKQTMTTPESREIDRQHRVKHIAYMEDCNKELDNLIKQYDKLGK